MQKRYYMKDEGNFFGGGASVEEQPNRKPRVIAFIVVLLLLLVALGFAVNYFLHSKTKKDTTASTSTTTVVTQMPTEMPTDTPSATPSATIALTPTSAKSNQLTVQVLNGSGVPGAASKIAASLKSLGYTVASTGNADTFDYTNVVIEVKKSEASTLTKLKTDLAKDYTIGSTSATLAASNQTDAIVIVGK
jgi:LytR cell envelope-related transcriptional attenuator